MWVCGVLARGTRRSTNSAIRPYADDALTLWLMQLCMRVIGDSRTSHTGFCVRVVSYSMHCLRGWFDNVSVRIWSYAYEGYVIEG